MPHNGTLPRLQSKSSVHTAIINELRRDHVRNNHEGAIDVNSNDLFKPRKFRCLLQALLSGTLLPSQYAGRMLPYGSHVDTAAQARFQYALLRLDPIQLDVRLFWSIIKSDTILDLTTGAFVDMQQWFASFSTAIRNDQLRDPSILVATASTTEYTPLP
jgi:hypothetical protein